MLHEILLSLSGIPSPIWKAVKDGAHGENESLRDYVSVPEQAMMAELEHLSNLHIQIKEYASSIAVKHPSLVCRAVATAVQDRHLGAFRKRIVEVESAILRKDAAYVGGYEIVPLSTIVTKFAPWKRRLEWLLKTVQIMHKPSSTSVRQKCTSAQLLGYLQDATHTGYSDLQDMASQLLIVGQTVWMRSVTVWVLYGQLSDLGKEDFMIQKPTSEKFDVRCVLRSELVPRFVSHITAETILAIGNALNQLRSQKGSIRGVAKADVDMRLMPAHLEHIQTLSFPLTSALLEKAMLAINHSISQNGLSQLMPLHKVIEICEVIQNYLLLGRGEFVITLINNADERMIARQKVQLSSQSVRKLGRVSDMTITQAELDGILAKTWSDLAALQSVTESEDEVFTTARRYLKLLNMNDKTDGRRGTSLMTLLPTPTFLQLAVSSDSALRIFLSAEAIKTYGEINALLLSLRRSEMRLSGLWKLTSHRRCHPAPLPPPMSSTPSGRQAVEQRRRREDQRTIQMRRYWSTMTKVLFVLNESNAYFHGEVIRNSWECFRSWLGRGQHSSSTIPSRLASRPGTASQPSDTDQLPQTARATTDNVGPALQDRDPRSLAQAHDIYLDTLHTSLLLRNDTFIQTLKKILNSIDHFVALFTRLQNIWQGIDLQEDDGVVDAFTNHFQDEKDVLGEMDRSRTTLEDELKQFVKNVKDFEKSRDVSDVTRGIAMVSMSKDGLFVPWKAKTLDRLIMKLNFMEDEDTEVPGSEGDVDEFEDA